MRVQLVVLTALILAVIIASFVGGGDDDPATTDNGTPGTAQPITTAPRGFPPASDQSVCRTLLTTSEAEGLVGRPLEEQVIEPQTRQCAWPLETGNPLDAELFLVVKEREDAPLLDVLERDWRPDQFRLEPVGDLGETAAFVIHRAGGTDESDEEFVVGLDVHVGTLHVVLGNGARDIWAGSMDDVRSRLRSAMERVLERIDERLT